MSHCILIEISAISYSNRVFRSVLGNPIPRDDHPVPVSTVALQGCFELI